MSWHVREGERHRRPTHRWLEPHLKIATTAAVCKTETVDGPELDDGVIRLRCWADGDAAWYADRVRDPAIQRFTTDPPTLDAAQVLAAIIRLRDAKDAEGFVIVDAVTGTRLGNIAVKHDGRVGEVSYWLAAEARGRGTATRALTLFTAWLFRIIGLAELRLHAHLDNTASQRVALRAGYQRDPHRDGPQEAKGVVWPMLAFRYLDEA